MRNPWRRNPAPYRFKFNCTACRWQHNILATATTIVVGQDGGITLRMPCIHPGAWHDLPLWDRVLRDTVIGTGALLDPDVIDMLIEEKEMEQSWNGS